jgi:hypothetical protein
LYFFINKFKSGAVNFKLLFFYSRFLFWPKTVEVASLTFKRSGGKFAAEQKCVVSTILRNEVHSGKNSAHSPSCFCAATAAARLDYICLRARRAYTMCNPGVRKCQRYISGGWADGRTAEATNGRVSQTCAAVSKVHREASSAFLLYLYCTFSHNASCSPR